MIASFLTVSIRNAFRKIRKTWRQANRIALAAGFLACTALPSGAWAAGPACPAKNLLDEWSVERKQEYDEALAASGKIENGKGIFWKIEKPGIEPSHLFGTIHLSDPRVLDIPSGAADAQYDARVVLLESEEILDVKKAMGGMLMKSDLFMLPPGKRIEDFLAPEQVETLAAGLKTKGIPLSAVSRMRPWMITATLAVSKCELQRKARGAHVLDEQIGLDAADYNIPVIGLETFEEQMNAMNSISTGVQAKSLLATLARAETTEDIMETMIRLYKSGDIGLFAALMAGASSLDPATAVTAPEFINVMVTRRNHRMAERAAKYLANGGAFMAVGALHLPGGEGLVELIRKQGYTVTAAE